ncbi:MAG: formate dehydrogenase subunit gamma [Acidobacteria bacterium]|nr:MAG: formate dehydrogenase subunit gamma [Acidobacteriota bacterium]
MSTGQTISPTLTTESRGGRILRYTFSERLNHWITGFAYTYCLATGLAFWSPYLFWMATIVGGGPTARFWHPWLGLIYVAGSIWMLKMWLPDMTITDADRAWQKSVKYYVENQDDKLPAIGRFNWGQKIFFWVMFWGGILLLLSGLGLWFVESIPAWLRHLSIVVHVVAALATIGGFIIHIYMGTAMVRGGFTSIVRGEVSTEWARHHHRLWYEKVTGQKSDR